MIAARAEIAPKFPIVAIHRELIVMPTFFTAFVAFLLSVMFGLLDFLVQTA